MSAAAIAGTFADFKLIRSRGVAQLVVEVPMEQADAALAALGGLPTTATDRWVAVARMQDKPEPVAEKPKGGELAKRAAILCSDPAFQRWIFGKHGWECAGEMGAAKWLRWSLGIGSRAEIDHIPEVAHRFCQIEQQFKDEQRFGPVGAQEGAYA